MTKTNADNIERLINRRSKSNDIKKQYNEYIASCISDTVRWISECKDDEKMEKLESHLKLLKGRLK